MFWLVFLVFKVDYIFNEVGVFCWFFSQSLFLVVQFLYICGEREVIFVLYVQIFLRRVLLQNLIFVVSGRSQGQLGVFWVISSCFKGLGFFIQMQVFFLGFFTILLGVWGLEFLICRFRFFFLGGFYFSVFFCYEFIGLFFKVFQIDFNIFLF